MQSGKPVAATSCSSPTELRSRNAGLHETSMVSTLASRSVSVAYSTSWPEGYAAPRRGSAMRVLTGSIVFPAGLT
ncbi:MAG: hypothetical protein EBT22_06765 [Chloroflexi bacterium]|nr:hypothetical protein [Chloroflexota bacterium]